MGGKSSSSSSTNQEQTDKRIAASDSAVVVSLDDNSNITFIDPEGQQFLADVLGDAEELFGAALDFATDAGNRGQVLVKDVLEANRSEDTQNFKTLVKWGAVITIGVVGLRAFGKR